jgi:hypothetical protein
MRLRIRSKLDDAAKVPHRWYAWRPVVAFDSNDEMHLIWLEEVWRVSDGFERYPGPDWWYFTLSSRDVPPQPEGIVQQSYDQDGKGDEKRNDFQVIAQG